MKVLWFEITTPSHFKDDGAVLAGWQDSLEAIVAERNDIDLYIAFEANAEDQPKVQGNVHYIPLPTSYSWIQRKKAGFSQMESAKHILPKAIEVIHQIKPDIIQVFGNEWPFGLVAKETDIPVVIHIQGAIIPYTNAQYPPMYNNYTMFLQSGFNPKICWKLLRQYCYNNSRLSMERQIWNSVEYYMGRTQWDKALCNTLHPGSKYYHVEEAIRPIFLEDKYHWRGFKGGKVKLLSTGISFWKGADVMLKTAHVLKNMGVDFEWLVAGKMDPFFLEVIEKHEKLKFKDNNIRILGFTQPNELVNLLCESTLYVHTAYIDNSPNSICEAQLLGVPVIATYVGGIPSLVEHNKDGVLVPANDPWLTADSIVRLVNDKERLACYGLEARNKALKRHFSDNIYAQLINCYRSILNKK